MRVGGVPFLDVPGNLVFMLNIDWFQPFERYNGILEKIQKSWQAPEIQLIHKFTSLQTLVSIELPSGVPQVFRQCFTLMKETKTAIRDAIDGLDVLAY